MDLVLAVAAGTIVALVTHALARARENKRWNREKEAQREQRKTELEGLLRLVSMEIVLHKSRMDHYLPTDLPNCLPLTTDAWEQARVSIAQQVPIDKFTSLVEYYATVQAFNILLDERIPPQERNNFLLYQYCNGVSKEGKEVREWMRDEYIGPMKTP